MNAKPTIFLLSNRESVLANVNSINNELQMTLIPFSQCFLICYLGYFHSSHIIRYIQYNVKKSDISGKGNTMETDMHYLRSKSG